MSSKDIQMVDVTEEIGWVGGRWVIENQKYGCLVGCGEIRKPLLCKTKMEAWLSSAKQHLNKPQRLDQIGDNLGLFCSHRFWLPGHCVNHELHCIALYSQLWGCWLAKAWWKHKHGGKSTTEWLNGAPSAFQRLDINLITVLCRTLTCWTLMPLVLGAEREHLVSWAVPPGLLFKYRHVWFPQKHYNLR